MLRGSRLENYLDALVLFVLEHVVTLRRVSERYVMRDHEARINITVHDAIEQRSHIALHMRLTRLDR